MSLVAVKCDPVSTPEGYQLNGAAERLTTYAASSSNYCNICCYSRNSCTSPGEVVLILQRILVRASSVPDLLQRKAKADL